MPADDLMTLDLHKFNACSFKERCIATEQERDRLRQEIEELRRQLDPMGEYASADELIAALRAEMAADDAMKRDARRYRWLRENINGERWYLVFDGCGRDPLDGDALDVAIDAAMGLTRPAEAQR